MRSKLKKAKEPTKTKHYYPPKDKLTMSKIGIQTKGSGAVMPQYFRGGGIAKRGTGAALKTGGRAGKLWHGGPRT